MQEERDGGGDYISAGDSTAPVSDCDDNVDDAGFCRQHRRRIGGGGDRQTTSSLNGGYVVFDIGKD